MVKRDAVVRVVNEDLALDNIKAHSRVSSARSLLLSGVSASPTCKSEVSCRGVVGRDRQPRRQRVTKYITIHSPAPTTTPNAKSRKDT